MLAALLGAAAAVDTTHLPAFHFVPQPYNWMNGVCVWGGQLHASPPGTQC